MENKLTPFIKWPGGKTRELKSIIPNLPKVIDNFYEPFVGGGAVYFSMEANKYYINDKSTDLINLYNAIRGDRKEELFDALEEIDKSWSDITTFFYTNQVSITKLYESCVPDDVEVDSEDIAAVRKANKNFKIKIKTLVTDWMHTQLVSLGSIIGPTFYTHPAEFIKVMVTHITSKIKQVNGMDEAKDIKLTDKGIEDNLLTGFKHAVYAYYRYLLNNPTTDDILNSAVYYFIRTYTYSSMFRYNTKGEFNVPYGGMSYNGNSFTNKVKYMRSVALQDRLADTVIENKDFVDFIKDKALNPDDFIFIDPPYDTEFSTYDQNLFGQADQERLAKWLIEEVNCKWLMVIKNTEFIFELYNKDGVFVHQFDKTYSVSFMDRNDQETEHLLITNYNIDEREVMGMHIAVNVDEVKEPIVIEDEEDEEVEALYVPPLMLESETETIEDDVDISFDGTDEDYEDDIPNPYAWELDKDKLSIIYVPMSIDTADMSAMLKDEGQVHIFIRVKAAFPSVHQIHKNKMSIIAVPVGAIATRKRDEYINGINKHIHERGFKAIVIPVLK